jgi:phosphoglycolate phosphatase-like HAD superfamily hydrolase
MSDWRAARLVFWDFDGVIKRSTEVKAQAFVELFRPFGRAVAERVRAHHLENGGLSRFEKIPHYLEWAGQHATPERIEEYCQRFATLVRQAVIDAEWVPGAERLLRTNPFGQTFVLVTATPLAEIEEILTQLDLRSCFADVYGAPTKKADAMRRALAKCSFAPECCVAIGDARADYEAAQANHVPFVLLRHESNAALLPHYAGESREDFVTI